MTRDGGQHWDNVTRNISNLPEWGRIQQIEASPTDANTAYVAFDFHEVDNNQLIFYGKTTPDLSSIILVVVNLDPHHTQSGWVRVPVAELGLDPSAAYQAHDLLTDARFLWHGEHNYVSLDPAVCPAHIFRLRRKIRTEHDFDYFL